MLSFLKEKEREYETPFTNTSCNAFYNRGRLSKKLHYLVEYYDFHMVIQHPQI